jgi:hypothetical protein
MKAFEDNVLKKLQEKKAAIELKKQEREAQDHERLVNPVFAMNKISRHITREDIPYIEKFLLPYDLSIDILFHAWEVKDGKDKLCHKLCGAFYGADCEICGQTPINQKKFRNCDPLASKVLLSFVLNNLGATWTDEETGKSFPMNPVKFQELPLEGKGMTTVIPPLRSANKLKHFESSYWVLLRGSGKNSDIPKGWATPEVLTEPEEVFDRLGREVSLDLPEYAVNFVNKITAIHEKQGKEAAKNELFRFLLTSFENGEEAAKIMNIEYPKREERPADSSKSSSEQLIS